MRVNPDDMKTGQAEDEEQKIKEIFRVASSDLRATLGFWQEQQHEAEQKLNEVKGRINHVLRAVQHRRWYELKDILGEDAVKTLCETEPDDPVSLLRGDWD